VLVAQVLLVGQLVLLVVILFLMRHLLPQLLVVLLHLAAVAVQEMQTMQGVVALVVVANLLVALEYQVKEMLAVVLQ
jgi:hypothetical protein